MLDTGSWKGGYHWQCLFPQFTLAAQTEKFSLQTFVFVAELLNIQKNSCGSNPGGSNPDPRSRPCPAAELQNRCRSALSAYQSVSAECIVPRPAVAAPRKSSSSACLSRPAIATKESPRGHASVCRIWLRYHASSLLNWNSSASKSAPRTSTHTRVWRVVQPARRVSEEGDAAAPGKVHLVHISTIPQHRALHVIGRFQNEASKRVQIGWKLLWKNREIHIQPNSVSQ